MILFVTLLLSSEAFAVLDQTSASRRHANVFLTDIGSSYNKVLDLEKDKDFIVERADGYVVVKSSDPNKKCKILVSDDGHDHIADIELSEDCK